MTPADLAEWARRVADGLPPFTEGEAAEAGQLAARLDATRTGQVANAP